MAKLCADPETMPGPEGLVKALKPELNKIFKPAFLGRMVLIPYMPIRDENLKQIIRLKLGKIQRRIQENHKIELTFDAALVQEVANRCTEVESGARNVDNILTNTLLPIFRGSCWDGWRREIPWRGFMSGSARMGRLNIAEFDPREIRWLRDPSLRLKNGSAQDDTRVLQGR
jgi:hypothetical protein